MCIRDRFGLVGGQLAGVVAIFAGFLFQVVRIRDLTGLNLARYGRGFLLSAGVSVSVVLVCLGTRPFAILARPIPNVLSGILGCVIAYALSLGVFFRGGPREIV